MPWKFFFLQPCPWIGRFLFGVMIALAGWPPGSLSAQQIDPPLKPLFESRNRPVPVKVAAMAEPAALRPGEQFILVLAVDIDPGWHIYAMNLPERDGLLATRVRLENDRFPAVEGWRESTPKLALDQALDQVIKVHSQRAEFRQVRSVPKDLPPGNYSIGGSVIYRACDDKICSLPNSLPFEARVTVAGNG